MERKIKKEDYIVIFDTNGDNKSIPIMILEEDFKISDVVLIRNSKGKLRLNLKTGKKYLIEFDESKYLKNGNKILLTTKNELEKGNEGKSLLVSV